MLKTIRIRIRKNKNNFILHWIFKITNTSCQLFTDEMPPTMIWMQQYILYSSIYSPDLICKS